jgi:predicted nuclease of predicted toxin-antitoxin system
MTEKIKFHLDESVDPDVAVGLGKYGVNVTTAKTENLLGQSDEAQFAFCCQQLRVLVTQDSDFLIMASQDFQHPGIVYYQPGTRSIGEIIRGVILIYEALTPAEMYGSVEYI